MTSSIAEGFSPPYYAVLFTSELRQSGTEEYGQNADDMFELARVQPGFLGFETASGTDGPGITISYWESLEAIQNWGKKEAHRAVQMRGRREWYSHYCLRIARVEEVERTFCFDDGV